MAIDKKASITNTFDTARDTNAFETAFEEYMNAVGKVSERASIYKDEEHKLALQAMNGQISAGSALARAHAERSDENQTTIAAEDAAWIIMVQNFQIDLQALQDLFDLRDKLQAALQEIEADIFTEEELAELDKLSEEDQLKRKQEIMAEKLRNGEITQAEYDAWKKKIDQKQANDAKIDALQNKLKQKDPDGLIALELMRRHKELLEEKIKLTKRIDDNNNFLNRLERLKADYDGTASGDLALLALMQDHNIETALPHGASFEEKVEILEQTLTEETITLEETKLEIEAEEEQVAKANETLNVALRSDQKNSLAATMKSGPSTIEVNTENNETSDASKNVSLTVLPVTAFD